MARNQDKPAETTTPAAPADKPKRGRKQVPENETAADRFRRMARQRMPRVLSGINTVAKLGGRGYEFTPEQAKKIVTDLRAAVSKVEDALKPRDASVPGSTAESYDI